MIFLFLFACMPLCIWFFYAHSEKRTQTMPVLLFGFFAGVMYCFAYSFFVFLPRAVQVAFVPNFMRTLTYTAYPIILFLIYVLFFRDTFDYKITAFFPLGAAFYAVFVPYRVLTATMLPGYFELLVLPLLYALQINSLSICLNRIFAVDTPSGSPQPLFVPLFFLCAGLPAAAEAERAISTQFLLYGGATAAFFVLAFLLAVYNGVSRKRA